MTASRGMGLALVTLLWTANALAQAAATPVGRWTTIDDETKKPKSVVSIYEENGKLFGKVERLYRAPNEDQNPMCVKCDGALKGKPVIGMVILRGLERDGDNKWSGGTIMDPENGKTYKCKLELEDGGKVLKVRGFIGFSLLGRTQRWPRAAPESAAQQPAAPAQQAPAQPAQGH
ncbi:DUF2147 domain-containing protein [Aggregicoccus sp. 17bor-14]|uniref:DUF2147 domain-containing protein n=1 Tax=Myxococcaceae TaxID=31 RepID=UPI00129C791E|nr:MULTISPECIES: DUF2147 domain-containing protein [Myxococcaceae]MBF5042012.1 DUF2147 domain-containing protein [Simulacricoccus sp. 17bor-14]MRI87792.1 DUF2147 domain-containing protein [Aggregicoccus sp. 17bor-14]